MKRNSGKTIRIYAVPSHQTKERTSGVDFARVIQPMKHLDGYNYKGYTFETEIFDIFKNPQDDWRVIADTFDLAFINYTVLDWGFAYMGSAIREKGKKMVMDIDDNIWHIRADNPTYKQFHDNNGLFIHNIRCMLDEVDRVTVTSSYLKNVVCDKTYKRHEFVDVIPNMIDLDMYSNAFQASEREAVTIMHFGSTTHFEDLLKKPFVEALAKIMREFPNVRFVTVGAFIPELKYRFGQRYENRFGDIDIYKWIKDKFPMFMEEADIVVAPLERDVYNRSKSFIKFLEYSSAKRPGVYEDIDQYREVVDNGVNGFLAESEENWYENLKKLVTSVDLRQKIGEEAYKTAKEYEIKDHLDKYAQTILKTLDKA